MDPTGAVSFSAAFAAGILTFLSPCILPLIPAYISYITGISFEGLKEARGKDIRKKTLIHSAFFISGFSVVFITLGASATYLGNLLTAYRTVISKIGGVLVVLFGLYVMGFLKLYFLGEERFIGLKSRKGSRLGSALLGITFAAAWTPCVGPVLGSVLLLAATKERLFEGILLLSVYSLGIAMPFIISAFLINSFLALFARFKRYMFLVKFICGLLLLLIGISLIRGRFGLM